MCGIAGYFGTREIDFGQIQACLKLMRRRGPDHAAYRQWTNRTNRHAYLLHSRLSIIDLDERANQPFNVGAKWIVFNGELYNYVELRRELAAKGVAFCTQSDTEVLLQAITQDGWPALDRWEGMWAFAVYDEQNGSLTLCRDRFGEKPLYLYRDESGLYFGSEVKFIVSLLGHRLEINLDHLYRNMINGYKALYKDGHTFFQGLTELPRASLMRLDADGTEHRQVFWQPSLSQNDAMTYDEAVAGARERLIRSLELRLRADVPLAFCMSGGIDSNALICVAKKIFGYDVHGFTIMNEDARYNERDEVEHVVRELGLRHTPIPLTTTDFLPNLRRLVRHHDSPVCTVNYYAHWLLMAQVAQYGYRISISGNGADELFTGYYDHHLLFLHDVRSNAPVHAQARQAWIEHVRPLVSNPHLRDAEVFVNNRDFRDHMFMDAEGFEQYLTHNWHEPFHEETYTTSLLRNRMLNEMFHEAVPPVLHEDDLNAMYYSIENRSPFLDRPLFEFCNRIPTCHLIRDGLAKVVLRDAMRGIVPDRILDNRRKVGFNAPIFSFLNVRDSQVRSAVLEKSPIYEHVRRDKIEALMGHADLPNSESKFLFYFLCAKLFLEEFTR